MKPNSGTIPEEIAIIKSTPIKAPVGCPWDISWSVYHHEDDAPDDGTTRIDAVPAFIADANSAKSIATGKSWASRTVRNDKNFTPEVIIKKNVPIKNVQICSLESRGSGGRAYKVIADGVYVDCREDVIMDAMLQEGINKGGILGGEYIWVKLAAHSRLIRVGSALHKKIQVIVNRKDMPVIKAKDLVPGTVYATKKDERALYLGRINTLHIESKYGASLDELKPMELNNQLLFIKIPEYGEQNIKKFIFVNADRDSWRSIVSWVYFMKEKEHKYVAAVGTMEHEGIIEMLRDKARNEIKEAFMALASGKGKQGYAYHKQNLGWDISRNSNAANMYDIAGEAVAPFDYEQLINFI